MVIGNKLQRLGSGLIHEDKLLNMESIDFPKE